MKFRKKPVVIEAVQLTEDTVEQVLDFCPIMKYDKNIGCIIPTLEGNHLASKGDWIIKGVEGEFYPCKPDIFQKTYERVEE